MLVDCPRAKQRIWCPAYVYAKGALGRIPHIHWKPLVLMRIKLDKLQEQCNGLIRHFETETEYSNTPTFLNLHGQRSAQLRSCRKIVLKGVLHEDLKAGHHQSRISIVLI
jgi:hypothetical protein